MERSLHVLDCLPHGCPEFVSGIAEHANTALDELLFAVLRRLTGRDGQVFGLVLGLFHVEEIRDSSGLDHFGIEVWHDPLLGMIVVG